MTRANETQVGGTHYKQKEGQLEHWDLATMYQWDPFQYQITKYVMRWKNKHPTHEKRLEDLKKARHFLDKYIEDATQWDHWTEQEMKPKTPSPYAGLYPLEGVRAGGATQFADTDDWKCEGYYGDGTQLYKCVKCSKTVRAATHAEAFIVHGDCAGRAYVNQG